MFLMSYCRIYEELRQPEDSVSTYKEVLKYDSSNTEAMACIAAHFFYTGQPEWALVFYK
jgi:tetratricopeptide repeat protein 8